MVCQKLPNHRFVFGLFQRAGAVYENPATLYALCGAGEDPLLNLRQVREGRFLAPAGIRPAAQHSQSGTRRIDQHPISLPGIRKMQFCSVQLFCFNNAQTQPALVLFNESDLMGMNIQCQYAAGILHQRCQMRAFPARRGAGIDKEFPRLRRNDVSNQHGAFILGLTQSFPQTSQRIVPLMAAYDPFRGPGGNFRFRSGFNQLLQQVFPGYPQRVGTEAKWRSGVVKAAQRLCFFDAQPI